MAWVRCCGGTSAPQGWIDITDTFTPQLGHLVNAGVGQYLSGAMTNAKWVRLVIQYANINPADGSVTMSIPNTTYRVENPNVGGATYKEFQYDGTSIKIVGTNDNARWVVNKIYVSYDNIMPTPVPTA